MHVCMHERLEISLLAGFDAAAAASSAAAASRGRKLAASTDNEHVHAAAAGKVLAVHHINIDVSLFTLFVMHA